MGSFRHSLTILAVSALSLGDVPPAWSRLIEGTEAKAEEFPEVFSLSPLCTATLIAPTVLLTSARCVSANPVFVSALPSIASFRHPDFDPIQEELAQSSFNVGIVILAKPVPRTAPALLASLENDADRASAFKRQGLAVVGFGGKRTLYPDATTGVKRWARTRALESTFSIFTTEGPASGLSHGDYGGPAFIAGADGVRRVIGVASGIPRGGRTLRDGRPGVSLYTGIRPEIIEWIEKTAALKLNKGE